MGLFKVLSWQSLKFSNASRSNQKEVQSQSVLRSEEKDFPVERVEKWMNEDDKMRRVVSVTYGDDDKCFVIICNRYNYGQPQVGEQKLILSRTFLLLFFILCLN